MIDLLQLVFPTPPRTKKNHGKVVQRGKRKYHVPSDAYTRFEADVQKHILEMDPWHRRAVQARIDYPVNCCALFYRDADRGDLVGYQQAIADALEKVGVLADDKWIQGWDGSRLRLDHASPRVVVRLTRLED